MNEDAKKEKRNYLNKYISQLNKDGNIINNPEEILRQERTFYEQLYSERNVSQGNLNNTKDSIQIKFLNQSFPKLNEDEVKTSIQNWKICSNSHDKRPPGLIALLLRFWHLLGNRPKNTTKGRDLLFNEGIRLLNMADTSLDRFT